jgi:uncharacterized membrane protein
MNQLVKTSNSDLIGDARKILSENWGGAIVATLIYLAISLVIGFIPGASLILGGPLMLGWALWALGVNRNQDFDYNKIFEGFNNFGNSLVTYLLMVIFIILWTLLFIIPGIIKGLAYSQTFYILADKPDIKPMEALRQSEAMMKGNKTKYFLLMLLFFLLALACLLTLGIGFLFLIPLIQVTTARFYQELKGGEENNEVELIGTE